MNCPACTAEMVKARATNFGDEYDYCQSCKKELAEIVCPLLESPPVDTPETSINLDTRCWSPPLSLNTPASVALVASLCNPTKNSHIWFNSIACDCGTRRVSHGDKAP